MATRRLNPPTLSAAEKDSHHESTLSNAEKSNTAPAVPLHVIMKLLGFTLAMVVVPIGSYFMTLNTLFNGNSTYSGATAAFMANVVLVGYIIVAMKEDKSDAIEAAEKERKGR